MLRRIITAVTPSLRAPLFQNRGVKTTTGIVGLDVVPDARATLIKSLNEVKELVGQMIPEDTEYRKSVEKTCEYRLNLIQKHETDEALEEEFGAQLEEMVTQSKDELSLIPKMAEWKPWEVPEGRDIPSYLESDPYEDGSWAKEDSEDPVPQKSQS